MILKSQKDWQEVATTVLILEPRLSIWLPYLRKAKGPEQTMLLVGPKDVVKKDVLSSLPWESLAYSWRATVLVKFMGLVAHHSCSGYRGLQQGWEAEALPHWKALRDTRLLPHLCLILPPLPWYGQPLGVPRCLSSTGTGQLLRQENYYVFSGVI